MSSEPSVPGSLRRASAGLEPEPELYKMAGQATWGHRSPPTNGITFIQQTFNEQLVLINTYW